MSQEQSQPPPSSSAVSSYNEWDPLEEVIVGHVSGAAVPPWHVTLQATAPKDSWPILQSLSGQPVPDMFISPAKAQHEAFVERLESEGIKVRRADPLPQTDSFSSPDWSCQAGYNIANPRDLLLVIGDQILETPCSWRARQFEVNAYRTLLHEYFRAGARWVAAPRPRLADSFYNSDYEIPAKGEPLQYAINESECAFDAADFIRCGRDIFATRSNVTNAFGLEWLRRHLGDEYRVHEITTHHTQPMHIDTTFVPLAPGKALINPEFFDRETMPKILNAWELREAPTPNVVAGSPVDLSSHWLTMNVLSLDERRVVVESGQTNMIEMLKGWGFEPIPVPFQSFYMFGGGFHCATLDIRRRGTLQSYF